MQVERLDDDHRGRSLYRRRVACDVNLCVAPATQTVQNVVTTIEPALLKFKFRHPFALSVVLITCGALFRCHGSSYCCDPSVYGLPGAAVVLAALPLPRRATTLSGLFSLSLTPSQSFAAFCA